MNFYREDYDRSSSVFVGGVLSFSKGETRMIRELLLGGKRWLSAAIDRVQADAWVSGATLRQDML